MVSKIIEDETYGLSTYLVIGIVPLAENKKTSSFLETSMSHKSYYREKQCAAEMQSTCIRPAGPTEGQWRAYVDFKNE